MADPTPTPPPAPAPAAGQTVWKYLGVVMLPILLRVGKYLLVALVGALTSYFGWRPAPVVKEVEVPVVWEKAPTLAEADTPMIATGAGVGRPTTGWVAPPAVIAENLDPAKTDHFDRTPAGKSVMGDEDTFLWRAVRKAGGFPDNQYPNIDQGQVGCCVGAGWKHSVDICQATAILSGRLAEWRPVSAEAIYGDSRMIGGNGRNPFNGDGSNGSWAKQAVEQDGVLAMQAYPGVDLSTFSPARARAWGKTGMPADLKPLAREHVVKGAALVKSWVDFKRAIQQGYPVALCSDQGFVMTRDATGTCRPSGTWSHCMTGAGVRTLNGKEQGWIMNNWGNEAHGGPCVPADAPPCGFWADAAVIERMVKQGDSFALADIVGFPARRIPIDWFSKVEPKKPAAPLFAGVFAPELAH